MIDIDTVCVNSCRAGRWRARIRPVMTPGDVLPLVAALHAAGIAVWLDGVWGGDALLGEQTRDHGDLDCVAALSGAPGGCGASAPLGFFMHENELPEPYRDHR